MELVIIEVYGHNNFFCQYTLFIERHKIIVYINNKTYILEMYTKIIVLLYTNI